MKKRLAVAVMVVLCAVLGTANAASAGKKGAAGKKGKAGVQKPAPAAEKPKAVAAKPKPAAPAKEAAFDKNTAVKLEEIYFKTGQADLWMSGAAWMPGLVKEHPFGTAGADQMEALKRIVEAVKEDYKGKILVEGHADVTGSPAANMELSKRRALAVKDYLVKNGIAASRIEISYKGQDDPVILGGGGIVLQLNRRVDVWVQPQ